MLFGLGLDGYYDETGRWQRTKFCFMACVRCTCGPPGGMYYSAAHDKRKPKGEQENNDQRPPGTS